MMDVRTYNTMASTLPGVCRERRPALRVLQRLVRFVGRKLGAAALWMAVLSPLYAFHNVMLQGTYLPLGSAFGLVLIGIGVSFIYIASTLTTSPEDRLPLTTVLLIGFGLAAGFAALWAPYK